MPERDRYIPGVPCWADTSQPDPEAAAEFYCGLFGWEFEDAMPPGSAGSYFIARLQGRRRRGGRRRIREGAPPAASGTPTSGSTVPTRRRRRSARPAAPSSGSRSTSWTPAGWRSSRIPRARRSASGRRGSTGAQIVNEHGTGQLQRPRHPRRRRREDVLRRGVRLGDARAGRWREMWTLPGYGDHLERVEPGTAQADGRGRRARGLRGRRRVASSRSPTTSPTRRRTGA